MKVRPKEPIDVPASVRACLRGLPVTVQPPHTLARAASGRLPLAVAHSEVTTCGERPRSGTGGPGGPGTCLADGALKCDRNLRPLSNRSLGDVYGFGTEQLRHRDGADSE
jgi:hypothetical protein